MQVEQLQCPQGVTIEGPLLISPRPLAMTAAGFESWNQRKFDDAVGEAVVFSRTTTPAPCKGFSGVFTISWH